MENLKPIYLTLLHCVAVVSLAFNYLYISDTYALVKIDALQAHERAQDAGYEQQQEQYARQIATAGKEAKDMFSVLKGRK